MKYLKVFENNKGGISNLIISLKQQKDNLYHKTGDFLISEKGEKNVYEILDIYYEDDYNNDELCIIYLFQTNNNLFGMDLITLIGEDLNNFYLFIDDPELYKQTKNFNL